MRSERRGPGRVRPRNVPHTRARLLHSLAQGNGVHNNTPCEDNGEFKCHTSLTT